MTDIQKIIEEEAKSIAYQICDSCNEIGFNQVKEGCFAGANFALSQLQHANRWRKFGTDELPEIGKQIVCRGRKNNYHLSKPISHDGIHWLAENFIEWKPI